MASWTWRLATRATVGASTSRAAAASLARAGWRAAATPAAPAGMRVLTCPNFPLTAPRTRGTPASQGPGGEFLPGGDGIQAVHHHLNLGQVATQIIRSQEMDNGLGQDGRVDLPEAPGRDHGLVQPQSFLGGQQLAVEVGRGEMIAVGQQQPAHPHPGQEFGQKAPQPPQARHQNGAPEQPELLRRTQAGKITLPAFREDARGEGGLQGLAPADLPAGGPVVQGRRGDHVGLAVTPGDAGGDGFQLLHLPLP